jgi:hypothetical protein
VSLTEHIPSEKGEVSPHSTAKEFNLNKKNYKHKCTELFEYMTGKLTSPDSSKCYVVIARDNGF